MKKIKRLLAYVSCAAMVASSFTAVSAAGKTVFVSPGESVQAAIDAADSGSVIVLRGGSYNESINLNKSNITIKAENGADVVFSTSETGKLEDITKEEKDKILISDSKKKVKAVREIKNLGEMKEGGIYPVALQNNEYLPIAAMQEEEEPVLFGYIFDTTSRIITSDDKNPERMPLADTTKNADGTKTELRRREGDVSEKNKFIFNDKYLSGLNDVYFHIVFWDKESFVPVKFNGDNTITYTIPQSEDEPYYASQNAGYYVNDIAFIDEKGEWYADRESGTVFIYPKDDAADVEFITDDKTYISGDKLSNVKISGIKFSDTLGSAIDIKNSENIEILDCKFENTSDTAVKLEKCNDSKIDNCDFNNLGGGAVLIDGNLNTVDNCGFSKIGCLFWTEHEPINIIGNKNKISHNKIYGAAHMAIVLDGDENSVEFNDISGALDQTGGSVLLIAYGTSANKITNNYFHDNFDIRTDQYTLEGSRRDSIIPYKHGRRRCSDYAVGLYGTKNNEITDNYIKGVTVGVGFFNANNNNITNDLIFSEYILLGEGYKFIRYEGDEEITEERYSEGNTIKNIAQRAKYEYRDFVSDGFESKNTLENIAELVERNLVNDKLELDEALIKEKLPDFEVFSLDTVGRYEVKRTDEPEMTGAVTLLVGSNKFGVNGETRENDVQPMIIDGRTLVPVRCISESFGEEVSWDADTKTVSVGSEISIVIGDKNITVGGEKKEIDVPAAIYESRTFVPLRAIAEALGKSVTWDERGLIVITDTETEFSENELSAMIAELK